jgi:C4-type Zn-finger protein
MNDVYIISPCPKCGGMPIVREQFFPIIFLGEIALYDVVCEDCYDHSNSARSPEQAIEEWEAYCKQETRSRKNA